MKKSHHAESGGKVGPRFKNHEVFPSFPWFFRCFAASSDTNITAGSSQKRYFFHFFHFRRWWKTADNAATLSLSSAAEGAIMTGISLWVVFLFGKFQWGVEWSKYVTNCHNISMNGGQLFLWCCVVCGRLFGSGNNEMKTYSIHTDIYGMPESQLHFVCLNVSMLREYARFRKVRSMFWPSQGLVWPITKNPRWFPMLPIIAAF